jgi:hypothetical protein
MVEGKSTLKFSPGRLALCAIFAISFATFLSGPTLVQDGIEILQETAMGGQYIVDATSNSLKLTKKGTPIVIFASAPQWTIFIYNKAAKKVFNTSLEKFQGSFANSFFKIRGDDPNTIRWKDSGQSEYCGIQAVHLSASREDKEKNLKYYAMREWQGSTRGDAFIVKDKLVPKVIPAIVCRYYGIPTFDRLPLSLSHAKEGKAPSVGLKTIKVKKLALTEKDFEQPKDCLKAKSEADTVYDPNDLPMF